LTRQVSLPGYFTEGEAMSVLEAALSYADLGWKVLPVYGFVDGRCACPQGEKCPSPGKHPQLTAWQDSATDDRATIEGWFSSRPNMNVGVRLGPCSGIIDIEFDNEEGRKLSYELLAGINTPTFRSARSDHRLFLWDDDLTLETVPKIGGLECRLGGVKAVQSVFPPSMQESGIPRAWEIPHGMKIQPLPDALKEMLLADNRKQKVTVSANGRSTGISKFLEVDSVGSGERNDLMYKYTVQQWGRMRDLKREAAFSDESVEQEVWTAVAGVNMVKCSPPLERDELHKLFVSAKQYVCQDFEQQDAPARSLTTFGLAYEHGEWSPGRWRLEVHGGHEPDVVIILPDYRVKMQFEDFVSAAEVHKAILIATEGRIDLDQKPGMFRSIWNGVKGEKGKPGKTGLRAKLLRIMEYVEPEVERLRSNQVAEFMLGFAASAAHVSASQAHPATGVFQDEDGAIWFRFAALVEHRAQRRFDATRNELSAFLREHGVSRRRAGANRQNWMYFSPGAWDEICRLGE
jgi:hypothetical protein